MLFGNLKKPKKGRMSFLKIALPALTTNGMESMKLIFVLLALAALSSVTGLYILSNRIASGSLASQGQFPYVVSITENGRHFCGGFIYSSQWVVTAAACVEGKPVSGLKVVAGEMSTINPDVNEQAINVNNVTIFPDYSSTNKLNDIALIRLTAEIQFDYANVDFILYNEVSSTFGLVMGWGASFEGGSESTNLRYGEVSPISIDDSGSCGNYSSAEFDFTTTICAGATIGTTYPGGSPCQYDEGSPLVQDFVDPDTLQVIPTAVGIFSKTNICGYGISEAAGIYTRLSEFSSWFLDTAGEQPVHPQGFR